MRGVLRRILSDNAACVHRDRRAVSRRSHWPHRWQRAWPAGKRAATIWSRS